MSTTTGYRDPRQTAVRPPARYRPVRADLGRQFGAAVANTAAVGEIAVREQFEALQGAVRRQPVAALMAALGAGWVAGRILAISRRPRIS